MESKELHPCPFYGGEARYYDKDKTARCCSDAYCSLWDHMPVDAWNTRVESTGQELDLECIKGILDCPRIVDEATIPKDGFDPDNENHRKQVVYNMSISHERIYQLKRFLKSQPKTEGVE